MQTYHTPVIIFVAILLGYLLLSLMLGAKKVYFDPWTEKPADPEGEPSAGSEQSKTP